MSHSIAGPSQYFLKVLEKVLKHLKNLKNMKFSASSAAPKSMNPYFNLIKTLVRLWRTETRRSRGFVGLLLSK